MSHERKKKWGNKPVPTGIYCPIIRKGGGVGIKPVPFDYFGKKTCTLENFPYFRAKIEHFLNFSKHFSLKMQ